MTTNNPSPVGATFGKLAGHALIYGGVAAVLAVVWMLLQPPHVGEPVSDFRGWLATIMELVFPVGGITLGVVKWRDRAMGGNARFSQLFSAALAVGFVFSVIIAIFHWYYAATIEPGYLQKLVDAYAEQLRNSGMSDSDVTEQIAAIQENLTPAYYAFATLARTLILSLLVGLIAAFVGRRGIRPRGDAPATG